MPDEADLQGCEHCGKEFPIEQCVLMPDCWICERCYADFKAHFDACQHEWEPQQSEHNAPGRYCHKCSGFQCLADVAVL